METKKITLNEEQLELVKSVLEEKYAYYFKKAMPIEAYDYKEILEIIENAPSMPTEEELENIHKEIKDIPWNGSLE